MYELLYSSHASEILPDEQLASILNTSRKNNLELNITGLLAYHEQQIFQLLEGPKEQVLGLYARIFDDRRHQSVKVAYQGAISQRAFSGWSMAFCNLDPANQLTQIPGYEDLNAVNSPHNLIDTTDNIGKDLLLFFQNDIKKIASGEMTGYFASSVP